MERLSWLFFIFLSCVTDAQIRDYQGRNVQVSTKLSVDTTGKHLVAEHGVGEGLPDFSALLADPVIIGVGGTPLQSSNSRIIERHEPALITSLDQGTHIDFRNEHNNPFNEPVIHRSDGSRLPLDSAADNLRTQPVHMSKLPGTHILDSGTHIDFQGEHNNPLDVPVIHRSDGSRLPLDSSFGPKGTHQIHEPTQMGVTHPLDSTAGHALHGPKPPTITKLDPGAHIDFQGQHGNTHRDPVIHTPDGQHLHLDSASGQMVGNNVPIFNQKPPGLIHLDVGTHIDFQGEHNNPLNEPVVHRPDGTRLPLDSTAGQSLHGLKPPTITNLDSGAHIDFQGQHDNTHTDPVIHTPDGQHLHIESASGQMVGKNVPIFNQKPPGLIHLDVGTHIDFQGEHNNPLNEPVVHRPDGTRLPLDSTAGQSLHELKPPTITNLDSGAHIDFQGQHGNTHRDPVIHTPDGQHLHLDSASGQMVGKNVPIFNQKPPGLIHLDVGTHIDFQGEHNNPLNEPVVHRPDGTRLPLDSTAGQSLHGLKPPTITNLDSGTHIDFQGQHGNTHRDPVRHTPDGQHLHLDSASGQMVRKDVAIFNQKPPELIHLDVGTHIDFQGEHNNPLNEPVVHRPDGTRLPLDSTASQSLHRQRPPASSNLDPGTHKDFQGQHGNTHRDPVIHTPDGQHLHFDGTASARSASKVDHVVGPTSLGLIYTGTGVQVDIKRRTGNIHENPALRSSGGNVLPVDTATGLFVDKKKHTDLTFNPVPGKLVGSADIHGNKPMIVSDFPAIDGGMPSINKPVIPSIDFIPDLFGPTDHAGHLDIVHGLPKAAGPDKSHQSLGAAQGRGIKIKATQNPQQNRPFGRQRKQQVKKKNNFGKRKLPKPKIPRKLDLMNTRQRDFSKKPTDLPPLRPRGRPGRPPGRIQRMIRRIIRRGNRRQRRKRNRKSRQHERSRRVKRDQMIKSV